MAWKRLHRLVFALLLLASLGLYQGCSSNNNSTDPAFISADLENLIYKHDLYFSLDYRAQFIEIVFSNNLDPASVPGNIDLYDKDGTLSGSFIVEVEGDAVFISFHEGYQLTPGWQYFVSISERVESSSGHPMREDVIFEIRTTSRNTLEEDAGTGGGNQVERTSVVCISDLHMGEERAVERGYSWFIENADALEHFVQRVQDDETVRELVILGDMFDEWVIPFDTKPFDGAVTNSREYFHAVRNATTNAPIFDTLAEIASGGEIHLVYVRGNHDMLTDPATLDELLPGVFFMGQIDGLGSYSPVEEVIMEHGHRYDFFNSPQPLVNTGHILPPGFFVSRLWAAGMEAEGDQEGALSAEETDEGPFAFGDKEVTFPLAWDFALIYTEAQFPALDPPSLYDPVILMSGIDGYADPFSFEGAKAMYVDGDIEALWPDTQDQHGVQAIMPVAISILNGHSDLSVQAEVEYLEDEERGIRIVVFGHTHEPMIDVYPPGDQHRGIYANTGSWVNEASAGYIGGSAYDVRTYVVYSPAAWTGSDLDVVTLYQYNLSDDGTTYKAIKLAEESLKVGQSP
ncbi:MAG: metallophosphoesterase [Deltaproteobacteria bacterium]|nr:metallophosphoesterase [Deltaproteobacteria bacterium]